MVFDFDQMNITAGDDVAFVAALLHSAMKEKTGDRVVLEFRVTIGLRKVAGQWTIVHEHHSLPAA